MSPQIVMKMLVDKCDLSHDEMLEIMTKIMRGQLTLAQTAGIIVALRAKGETVTELAAAARVMRDLAIKVPVDAAPSLVDTCGTGGDGASTFNISTTSAIVAAAAGAKIAKHGGRSVSSACGSADVMQALGVNINLSPLQVAECVSRVGVGFMFAPNHHSAMKHTAGLRQELGIRTLFNLLGPLTNPAGAKNQVLGVFSDDLLAIIAQVLKALGANHVLVVHGADGLDEISLAGETRVAELREGKVHEFTIDPSHFGLDRCVSDALVVDGISSAKRMTLAVLENVPGPAKDIVTLNAGAAIYVGNVASTLGDGVRMARAAIENGSAQRKLDQLIEFTNGISSVTKAHNATIGGEAIVGREQHFS